jgi:hypothetical protein
MSHPSPHGTILPESLWPALLGNSRVIVAAHERGEECQLCPSSRRGEECARLRGARRYLADPEMLGVEREAQS